MSRLRLLWIGVVLCGLGSGCGSEERRAPATGTYGPLTNAPSRNIAEIRAPHSAMPSWTNGELAVVQTELSPATLYYCSAKTISFFSDMSATGIGGPTFAAIETEQGPKIFKPGQTIDAARMRESWFVVWWAGANGWTNWDSPWFLTLQHRPASIRFDTNGLHFTFNGSAGYAALMPMYGYYKPMQTEQMSSPFAQLKEKRKRVLTWEWFKALPADPLARARYWASALREFPIECEESFSVDRADDSVIIRQSFRWISWNDDWNTKHLKLAPVSPVLALAYKEGFPAQFSKKPFDMEIFTSFGPYYGIEGIDSYEVTLPVLRYVHETAGAGELTGASNGPCFVAWQEAHASGDWEWQRERWPASREEFLKIAPHDWPTFASQLGISPRYKAANALGAARVAYRLGDADVYAEACHVFARAIVQWAALQRGQDYFRAEQPWRSMEPIGEAELAWVTWDGWHLSKPAPAPAFAQLPDLARIWRDVQPVSGDGRPDISGARTERLIPGGERTPFLSSSKRRAPEPDSLLVHTMEAASSWPRITWPDWKTPSGAAWNFGQIAASTNLPTRVESWILNNTTRVTVFSR